MSDSKNISRRNFLKATGCIAGAAALGNVPLVNAASHESHANTSAPAGENTRFYRGRMFFTNDLEFKTLSQACERIFPKDETGPGAIDLFVPYFIDNQLAGAWGYNAREYMGGPHAEGVAGQGYQSQFFRRDIFLQGIAALNTEAQSGQEKNFPDLTGEQMDAILKKCEAGDLATRGFNSSVFFTMLRTAVLAGVYADPIYAGNNEMNGWRMKEYPGAQMSYAGIIEESEFQKIQPVSLADMQ